MVRERAVERVTSSDVLVQICECEKLCAGASPNVRERVTSSDVLLCTLHRYRKNEW